MHGQGLARRAVLRVLVSRGATTSRPCRQDQHTNKAHGGYERDDEQPHDLRRRTRGLRQLHLSSEQSRQYQRSAARTQW